MKKFLFEPGKIVHKFGCNPMRIIKVEGDKVLVESANGTSKKSAWYENMNELLEYLKA